MILAATSKQYATLDKICTETWDYYDGKISEPTTTLHVDGKITDLDADVEGYAYDYFIENDFFGTSDKTEISKYIVPYTIQSIKWNEIYATTAIGFVILMIGLIISISKLVSRNKKKNAVEDYSVHQQQGNEYNHIPEYTPQGQSYESNSFNSIDTSNLSSDRYSNQYSYSNKSDDTKPPCEL